MDEDLLARADTAIAESERLRQLASDNLQQATLAAGDMAERMNRMREIDARILGRRPAGFAG